MWNEYRLAAAARQHFRNRRIIVVSNREPYLEERRGGRILYTCPAGGLTSALRPLISAIGGTWVAGGGSKDSGARTRVSLPPERPAFTLRRVTVPAAARAGYYEGAANQALWPLCHNVYRRPLFRDADWAAYRRVNRLFADAVLEEAGRGPAVVFVQDYHLALLPRILRTNNPDLIVGQFWHIPWPAPEVLRMFPWADELLEGMLGNHLLGFHLDRHCNNFLAAAEEKENSAVDAERGVVCSGQHRTIVRSAPISIDFDHDSERARAADVDRMMESWRQRISPASLVGVGIDRGDYTKGIPERLSAVRTLLEQKPEWRGKLTFVQVAVPTRGGIPEYADLERTIHGLAEEINSRWGTENWKPVILESRSLGQVEMMALHRLAHFCMVTPLHDGMNLVAKEFVASRSDLDGVLILSRFAGAAEELRSALLVNPFSESALVGSILQALTMPAAERRNRMAEARAAVSANNIYSWAATMVGAFGEVISRGERPLGMPLRYEVSVA